MNVVRVETSTTSGGAPPPWSTAEFERIVFTVYSIVQPGEEIVSKPHYIDNVYKLCKALLRLLRYVSTINKEYKEILRRKTKRRIHKLKCH